MDKTLILMYQSIKIQLYFPKIKPTNKKTLLLNFGDQCNKQLNVHSLLGLLHSTQSFILTISHLWAQHFGDFLFNYVN